MEKIISYESHSKIEELMDTLKWAWTNGKYSAIAYYKTSELENLNINMFVVGMKDIITQSLDEYFLSDENPYKSALEILSKTNDFYDKKSIHSQEHSLAVTGELLL